MKPQNLPVQKNWRRLQGKDSGKAGIDEFHSLLEGSMKNRDFKSIHAGLFAGLFLTVFASIAQPSLPPASMVINEPTRLSPAEQKNAASGKTLPSGKTISFKSETETKNFSAAFAGPCASDAITCIEIISQATEKQENVPFTFGQPFKMGDWKHRETGLVAKDNLNNVVALQFDQISSHQDGSARFAVLSAEVKALGPKERRVVNIFSGKNDEKIPYYSKDSMPIYKLEATIYHPQGTIIKFGNRNGHTPGIAFAEGEKITIDLTGPASESYSIVLNSAQTGGGHKTLSKITEAFTNAINSQSKVYEVNITGSVYENLWISTKNLSGGNFKVKVNYSGPAKIQIIEKKSFEKPQIWVAQSNAKTGKENAPEASKSLRLQGPLVSEIPQILAFRNAATGIEHSHLVARLDSRIYHKSGAVWTDIVLENNWTFKKNPGNIQYELSIQENGNNIHQQSIFTHFHHARWHKYFWSNIKPEIEVRHHMPYFMSSAAVWNYDLSITIPETVLQSEASRLKKVQAEQQALGPMKNVFMEPMFPSTGGRAEIAPLPRWTALYLISQDSRAYASMMANTDAAAAVPIHYRDEKTDQPVEPITHPELTLYNEGNVPYSSDRTIWVPDTAHQGSFAYVPYLLRGDRFYMDEMLFWSTWNIISYPVDYRSKEKALINRQQVRGQAWVLRSLGEVERSLSDDHVMKASFKKILKNNLSWYKVNYIDQSNGSPMGFLAYDQKEMSTWMNDFLVTVFALLAENKEPDAKEIHAWLSRFSVGRFLADDEGFCAARAPGYYWKITDAAGKSLTRWSELFKENYPDDVGKPCSDLVVTGGYPNSPAGYTAYARGMLAASANAGYKDATKAYYKWKSMTPGVDSAFPNNPSWAIVPRQ